MAARTCLFDLETIGDKSAIPHLPEPEADTRLKDPVKIKRDIQKKKDNQLEMLGVDPRTNLICCASFADYENREMTSLVLKNEDSEAELLTDIWKHMIQFDRFVTFNGNSFDVECLNFHSAIRNVLIPIKLSQNNYRPGNHFDLRMIFSNGNARAKGKFDFYCKRFGFEGKTGVDGSQVQGMWDDGLIEEIKEYCESDVKNLYNVYKQLKETRYL
jgi:predicted PolB exonuclease-like 3'-5' exonuclease